MLEARLRFFRWHASERPLSFPIHPVRMDTHGSISHRCPSAFHHEQHLRRNDLVVPPCSVGHHQRHICIRLWNHLWSYATHQIVPQKDRRRLRRGLDLYHCLWLRHNQCAYALQILHLSRQRMFPLANITQDHSLTARRTSVPTFLRVLTAPLIQSSFRTPTAFPNSSPYSSPTFHLLYILHPCNFIYSSLQPSLPSLPPLVAFSPPVSSVPSKSKISANRSQAMAVSPIGWIVSLSWASFPSCTTRASLLCTRPALEASLRRQSRDWSSRRWWRS